MQGESPKAIQELAGHAHLSTTMRYMHLAKGHKEQAIRLLDHRTTASVTSGSVAAGVEATSSP